MWLKVLRSKIHRATITESQVDYIGSITLDEDLLDASGIVPGECVLVCDLADGARFETYAVPGERGSGTVCINGAAARLVNVGDLVIIMAFAYAEPDQAKSLKPTILLVDEKNRLAGTL